MNTFKFIGIIFGIVFGYSVHLYALDDAKEVKVISITSVKTNLKMDGAAIGDFIKVNLSGKEAFDSVTLCCDQQHEMFMLAINDASFSDIKYYDIDFNTNSIVFQLDSTSKTLQRILKYNHSIWGSIPLSSISVSKKGQVLKSDVTHFKIYQNSNKALFWGFFVAALIIIVYVLMIYKTNILRLGGENSPYSLAHAQLAWWSLIILVSIAYLWITTGNLPELTGSVLALLGISAATTGSSKYVNTFIDKENQTVLIPAEGFFKDIMSDNNSTNMHRAQLVFFTLFMGIFFVVEVFLQHRLYNFSETYLFLTGISSGTYVFIKLSEPSATPATDQEPTDGAPAVG